MLHDLNKRIRAKETLIGTWLFLNDVGVAEIVARAGFDFVMIDMEHSATDFSSLRNLILAVEQHCPPIVRVKANRPEAISAALDLGPAGVMVPRVNTAVEAAEAVQYAKYTPLGQRGFGPWRASDYLSNMPQFMKEANEKQLLWIQIEHKDAVANIHEIVKVPGIDAYFLGLSDLSQSLGHLGDTGHAEVLSAAHKAAGIIHHAGIPFGSAFGQSTELDDWKDDGMRIFTVGADIRFVVYGAQEILRQASEALDVD
jgi:4-hydroxy-2-oxoheptanedioate aldolase